MKKALWTLVFIMLLFSMYSCENDNVEKEIISTDVTSADQTNPPIKQGIDNKVLESDGIIETMNSSELNDKISKLYKGQNLNEVIKVFGKEPFYVRETNENVFEYYSGEITIRLWGESLFQACLVDNDGIHMIELNDDGASK